MVWRNGFAPLKMDRFHYYRDYLWHVFTAKTRHGTHSPFVYRLLEEVIYPARLSTEPTNKVDRLTARLAKHFGYQRVCLQQQADLVDLPTGTVLVLRDIHASTEKRREWQAIRSMEAATVTIDLFRVGLVFFREGQAKEHFRIRY